MAEEAAGCLRCNSNIREVLLFGSIARDGQGNDLDIIIVAEPSCAENFIAAIDLTRLKLSSRLDQTYETYLLKKVRLQAAMLVLSNLDEFMLALHDATELIGRQSIDIFVFPPDWRQRLTELQHRLPNRDPRFMKNIARDAVRIA